MNEEEYFLRLSLEFKDMSKQPPVTITLSRDNAWCLLSTIQLATRHPEFVGPTRQIAEKIARSIQSEIANTPILNKLAEIGWNADYDVPID